MHEDARRRLFWKIAAVDLVESLEASITGHAIDVAFHHVIEGRACCLEAMLHLREDKFALMLKREQLDVAGLRIEGRQARYKDHAVRNADGIGPRAPAVTFKIPRD